MTSFTRATVRFANHLWEPLFFKELLIEQTAFKPDPLPQRIEPREVVEFVFESNGDFGTEATFTYATAPADHQLEVLVSIAVSAIQDNRFSGRLIFSDGAQSTPESALYNLTVDGPSEDNHVTVDVSIDNRGQGFVSSPRTSTVVVVEGLLGASGGFHQRINGPETTSGRRVLFGRDSDGFLVANSTSLSEEPQPGSWVRVDACPVGIVGSPQLIVWPGTEDSGSNDRYRVFVTGVDGNVYVGRVDNQDYASVGVVPEWLMIPGTPTRFGPGVASWQPGRVDVFATEHDGTVVHTWTDDDDTYHEWEPIGGQLAGPPAATAWEPERLDIVGRGPDLHSLQHCWYTATSWFQWESKTADMDGNPTIVSLAPGDLSVIAPATTGHFTLLQYYFQGWGRWCDVPSRCASDPVATSGPGLVVSTRNSAGHFQIDSISYPPYWQ